jgi:hypothetical protein
MLRDCVSSLLVQCDRVRVFLNEYPDVPAFLDHPRVEVRRSQDWDDRGDAGKFFWIDRDRDAGGYRLIVDDDLIFPPEFAATMTGKVAALDNKAVFAAHGVLLRQPIGAYYETSSRATTFHFGHQLDQDRGVHIGATNAMCFHAEAVQMRWSDLKHCNSADLWLALYAQDKGLPVLTPARPRDWIRENRQASPSETIYNHSLRRTRSRFDSSLVQDAVIRHAKPFTLQVLGRAKCAFYMHVTNVDDFRAAMQSWLSWRPLDVEWVVLLVHEEGDAGTATAVKSLEIPHEVHLVKTGRDFSNGMAALCEELGVDVAFCATDAVRFSPAIATDTGSVKPPNRDAMDLEPLVAGSTVSHGRLTIQSFRGARSGQTQAFVMARSGDRLYWLGDLVGQAAVGQARSPLDAAFAKAFEHESSPNAQTVPAIAKSAVGLNDVFEQVLVLNFDQRQDRWKAVSHQFERFGIQADRMCAIDGRSADIVAEYEAYSELPLATVSRDVPQIRNDAELYLNYGSQRARIARIECMTSRKAIPSAQAWAYLRSHELILERALEEQTESLVVFEDDIVLHNDFQAIFAEAMTQLPSDWLIVQLGTLQYNWSEPWVQWRSSRLYQTNGAAVGSHAVGMRFDIYPFLLDHVRRMDLPYDVGALSAATRAFPDRCFVIHPNLAIQRLDDSDIGTSEFKRSRGIAEIAQTYRWNLNDYRL